MLQGLGSLDPMQLVKPESYGSGLVVHVGLCGPGGPTVSGILRGATPRLGVAGCDLSILAKVLFLLRGNTNTMGLQYTLSLVCLNHTQLACHSTAVSMNLFFEHSLKKYRSLFSRKPPAALVRLDSDLAKQTYLHYLHPSRLYQCGLGYCLPPWN